MKHYAGIGSRKAHVGALQLAEMLAARLRFEGWTLRTGHAPGMDQAFEGGAMDEAEVYLPWPTFEGGEPIQGKVYDHPTKAAEDMARQYHAGGQWLRGGTLKLHARNSHQILGYALDDPVTFVVCWTRDGSLDGSYGTEGGTGQALRIASAYSIPVFNLARPDHLARVEDFALTEEAA